LRSCGQLLRCLSEAKMHTRQKLRRNMHRPRTPVRQKFVVQRMNMRQTCTNSALKRCVRRRAHARVTLLAQHSVLHDILADHALVAVHVRHLADKYTLVVAHRVGRRDSGLRRAETTRERSASRGLGLLEVRRVRRARASGLNRTRAARARPRGCTHDARRQTPLRWCAGRIQRARCAAHLLRGRGRTAACKDASHEQFTEHGACTWTAEAAGAPPH
jgi:hypothetical protein